MRNDDFQRQAFNHAGKRLWERSSRTPEGMTAEIFDHARAYFNAADRIDDNQKKLRRDNLVALKAVECPAGPGVSYWVLRVLDPPRRGHRPLCVRWDGRLSNEYAHMMPSLAAARSFAKHHGYKTPVVQSYPRPNPRLSPPEPTSWDQGSVLLRYRIEFLPLALTAVAILIWLVGLGFRCL
jgi:hypothetical protein